MAKKEYLQIRVTPELKSELRKMAEKKSMPVSQIVLNYVNMGLQAENKVLGLLGDPTFMEMIKSEINKG